MRYHKSGLGNPVELAIRRLARQETRESIQALAAICGDRRHRPRFRVLAAIALLDHGYGRPRITAQR